MTDIKQDRRPYRLLSGLCLLLLALPAWSMTAQELVEKVDELYRMDSSRATMRMTIETPDWQRTLMMDTWSLGMDYTLVRITSPKKDAGIATLKRNNQMWNYFPKVRRVIKVPPSMMMGSWMGSDFTNDDLVREDSLAEDYAVVMQEQDSQYLLTLSPKANTVTVWGKIEVTMSKQNLLPKEQRFYDERGELMRKMLFSEVKTFDGKTLPAKMELIPLNKNNHKTIVEYTELQFDVDLNQRFFSLQEIKR